jgi:hypothetical protein
MDLWLIQPAVLPAQRGGSHSLTVPSVSPGLLLLRPSRQDMIVPGASSAWHRADAIERSLPAPPWKRISAGFGSKGEPLYDWALMQLSKQDG